MGPKVNAGEVDAEGTRREERAEGKHCRCNSGCKRLGILSSHIIVALPLFDIPAVAVRLVLYPNMVFLPSSFLQGSGKSLVDERFSSLFEREEFEVDAEEYRLRNPTLALGRKGTIATAKTI